MKATDPLCHSEVASRLHSLSALSANRRSLTRIAKSCRVAILLSISSTLPLAGQVPTDATVEPDARFAALRSDIIHRVEQDVPSMAIAVVTNGRVVWEEALGWADREARIPSTPFTLYPVASVSKSFMSTAAVILNSTYGVPFEAPISQFVDSTLVRPLAGRLEDVTVRDLLAMTGGFPMGFKSSYDDAPPPNPKDLLRHHGGLIAFPPGEVFHYSNFSPSVLEPLIEQVTHNPFGEFMRRQVFDPLGMTSTYFDVYDDPPERDRLAATYRGDGSRNPSYVALPAGGGGGRSTIHDMARFALTHLGYSQSSSLPKFGPKNQPELYAATTISGGEYALGWWVRTLPDGSTLIKSDGHGGGAVAVVLLHPAKSIGVVVLTNIRKPESDDAFNRMYADIVAIEAIDALDNGFKNQYEEMLRDRERSDRSADLRSTISELLGNWEGYVRTFEGEHIRLSLDVRSTDDIHIQVGRQFPTLVSNLRLLDGGVIGGRFPSSMPNDEGYNIDHVIRVNLLPYDGELLGYLASNVGTSEGAFDLPHFVRLQREN